MRLKREGFTLYFCYAQSEKALRITLETHLGPLKQQGLITTWYDDEILAGAEWQPEIRFHLQTADIILLLISPNFFASDHLYQEDMSEALARHERGEALVIPILLRPVDWEATPISKLSILPSNHIPVTSWRSRDNALLDIAQSIRKAVNALRADIVTDKQSEVINTNTFPAMLDKQIAGLLEIDQIAPSLFFFNMPFANVNEFYGRRQISTKLVSRAAKRASTSIVGPRRIGKTWLLEYLKYVISAQPGSRFLVASIDATSPRCTTVNGFVSLILEEWDKPDIHDLPEITAMIHLERIVKDMRNQGIIPLLFIDEFEFLVYHEDVFDLQFFAYLRSIAGSGLALIVASKRPPIEIISQEFQSSPFFNILEQVTLKPFDEKEAEAFIQAKSDLARFTLQEREYFKHYGKTNEQEWPPARLQMVGTLLLEEKLFAGQAGSDAYQPDSPFYWHAFAKRLEEIYQKVVL